MASAQNPYVSLKASQEKNLKAAQAADTSALKSAYDNNLALAEKQYNSNVAQARQVYDQDVNKANKQYDTAARQSFVNYRQNQAALPEQLSALGLTGGQSESANVALQTAYAGNLATNDAARQSALTDLGNTYQNSLGNLQTAYQGNIGEYRNNYLAGLKDIQNDYLKQQYQMQAEYDRLIAEWEEAERQRLLEEQAQAAAAAARSYSYRGGSGGSSRSSSSSGSGGSGDVNYADLVNGMVANAAGGAINPLASVSNGALAGAQAGANARLTTTAPVVNTGGGTTWGAAARAGRDGTAAGRTGGPTRGTVQSRLIDDTQRGNRRYLAEH